MGIAQFIFTEATPASASTVASAGVVQNAANYLPPGVAGPLETDNAIDIVAEITGGTGGALDVYLQTSGDNGITWYDSVHFAQVAAGTSSIQRTCITELAQPTTAAPVVVGKNLSPALAVATAVQGGWGDRARLVYVAGASTSGAGSVKVSIYFRTPSK